MSHPDYRGPVPGLHYSNRIQWSPNVRSAPLLTCLNELFWQHLMRGRRELSERSKAGGADLVICTLDPCRPEPPIPRLSTPSSYAMPSEDLVYAFWS